MIGSLSNSSNMHEVVDDNINNYQSMVMDAIEMNQDDVSECSIVDEESNAYANMFFYLLKDFSELLWVGS